MTSLRAKLVNLYFRLSFKNKPLHDMEPQTVRKMVEKSPDGPLPKGVTITPENGPIKGEWHEPDALAQDVNRDRVILYCHGGGYVFGSPKTHMAATHGLALHAQCRVFSLDYRLAPENPCPAAIEDAVAAYLWLLEQGVEAKNIAIGGDSAGAGLTLATLQALRDAGHALPACAVLYSPYADLAFTGASIFNNKHSDAMFNMHSMLNSGKFYVGDLSPTDPRCSPLYGDMSGLPPLAVFASREEMLFDDAVRIVEKAKAQGVDVTFLTEETLIHAWPIFYAFMPEAKQAIQYSAAFIKRFAAAS